MKKCLRTGKKALSVFMAVLMALTAMVFAAPQKASAVDAGLYDTKVSIYIKDFGATNGGTGLLGGSKKYIEYTGPNMSVNWWTESAAGMTLEFYATDGSESVSETYNYELGNENNPIVTTNNGKGDAVTKTVKIEKKGFPKSLEWLLYAAAQDGCGYYIRKIEVAPTGTDEYTTIWEGSCGGFSEGNRYQGKIDLGKTEIIDGSDVESTTSYNNWYAPRVDRINWVESSESNLTISTGTDTVSRKFAFNVLDQYGVVLSEVALKNLNSDVNYSASCTDTAISSNASDSLNYSKANNTSEYSLTVNARPSLKSLEKGKNAYRVSIQVTAGTLNETKSFTIYDPKYTIFFDANGGNDLAPKSTEVYYGESLASQAEIDKTSNYPTGGTYDGHSWLGLFDSKTGGNKMDPDEAVKASKTYYAQWNEDTYVVVFLDKEGKSVDIQYVPYGESADANAAKEKLGAAKATADTHFVFANWDQSVDNVSENMIVKAVYTEGTHTFDGGKDVAANCQHGAGKEYTCTVCGYNKVETTGTALGDHTLTGLIQDVAPTCTETGKGHKECTVCGEKVEADTTIPALGHSYKIEIKTPATCSSVGERALTCTRCGAVETEEIPMIQHNYAVKSHENATCDHSSYDVMECSVCGDTYKKYISEALNEHAWSESYDEETGILTLSCSVCKTIKTVDIGADLENFVSAKVTTEPTCKEDGLVTVTAGDDTFTVTIGKDRIPHSYETEVVPATCTTDGMIINVCSVCSHRDETNAKTIAKLGHDYTEKITTPATCTEDGTKTLTCSNCGDVKTEVVFKTGHKVSDVVVDCTSGGKIKCANCGEKIADVPAKEHDYSGSVRIEEATCKNNGIKYTKCVNCNAEKAELIEKTTDHRYGEWEVMVQAKCGAQGVEKRTCDVCGASETKVIEALKHEIKRTEIPETCIKAGSIVEKCTRIGCDYEKTTVIQPKGHTLGEGVVYEQTCVNGKYTRYDCVDCDYYSVELASGEEGKALGHDFTKVINTAPATCEEDGVKTVQCSRCDATEEQIIPKLGHSYRESTTVAPTCTMGGYTVMVCANDESHTYNRYDGTDAKGHTWSAWVTTKESTNLETGKMERICTVEGCGAKEEATIPAGGHSFAGATGKVIKAATCKEEGEVQYSCTAHANCGVTIIVASSKLAHSYVTDVTYATCHKEGSIVTKCRVCNEVLYQTTINKRSHSWSEWTVVKTPTCQEGGEGLEVRVCENCGDKEERVIPKLESHNFKKTVVPPTCTQQGYTIFACMGCGVTYRDFFVAPLGHDMKDDWVDVAETCTTPGGRQRACHRTWEDERGVTHKCDYVEFEEDPARPATGHSFSEWKFVTHPSVKDAYAKWRQCMNTGCTHTEYEKGEKGSESVATKDGVNIYYQVNYYNEWATDTYDVLTGNLVSTSPTKTYTKLAKTYKTVKLATIYVLKGQAAVYPNKLSPVREKDADWGEYVFEGWTEKGQKALDKDASVEPANLLDLSKISENTDVYALFRCKDRYYRVVFYNANGSMLTIAEHILHGHSAEWPAEFGTPTLPENNEHMYKFKGWSYDFSKIYDDVAIIAQYDSIMKSYVVVYHDWNGKELGRETIAYGDPAVNIPAVAERPEDNTYVYQFLNKWALANGEEVNLESFTAVPDGAKDGDEVHVYAKHSQRLKVYKVNLRVWDPFGMTCGGATVQVINSQGRLVASTTTDVDGYAYLSLNYSTAYSVKISRGNYALEGTMTLDTSAPGSIPLTYDITQNLYRNYNVSLIDYTNSDDKPEEKCNCICHSFIGGLWITVLNLIYRLFKVKQVCCYDMYVVHGDKLVYGPN